MIISEMTPTEELPKLMSLMIIWLLLAQLNLIERLLTIPGKSLYFITYLMSRLWLCFIKKDFQTEQPIFALIFEAKSALRGLVWGRRTFEAATTKLHHRYISKTYISSISAHFSISAISVYGNLTYMSYALLYLKSITDAKASRKEKRRKILPACGIIVILMKVHILRHNNPRTLNCSYFCYNPFHTHE